MADTATLRDEKGNILGYETSVFNEHGDVIENIEYDDKHNEIVKHVAEYDNDGNVLEEQKFIDGELTEITAYEYDLDGNLVLKKQQNVEDGFEIVNEYRYDDRGNRIYNATFRDGNLIFENKCTYDDEGYLRTQELFEIDPWSRKVERHERLIHERR